MRRIIMASITAVVVIAVLAGTLIPVLDDATAKTDTFTNGGYYRMSKITADTSTTITWDHTKPLVLTVDGEDMDMSFVGAYSSYTILGSDVGVFRYFNENTGYKIQKWGGTFATAGTVAETDASITISGFNISYTFGSTTSSITATEGYVISADGDYVMKKADTAAHVGMDDSIVCLAGMTSVDSNNVTIYASGTIDDGLTFDILSGVSGVTYSVGTPTFNYVEDSDHVDLVSLSSIVFDFTRDSTTQTITYSYFIVPYEVTAERSVHFTDGENAIFNAIPVIVIVALLLAVAAIVLRSRMD